ncbi:MAG TPA: hypothetical protein EYG86_02990 [Crocinitomicaceae bacterium]|nr:hypothetical protein [Crocinitomicaceae bacterium]
MRKLFLYIVLCCFLFNSYSQTTWYVATSGNNSNTGLSEVSAFATISNAIASSTCGDSIYVLGGTYHEKIFASTICPENNRKIIWM